MSPFPCGRSFPAPIRDPSQQGRPSGAQFREAARFSAATRQGDWLDYRFDVEPHSMNQDSPTRKYRRVLEWIQHVVLPVAPIAAEQGLKLDVERLAKITGAMLNIEEAPGIFTPLEAGAEKIDN